LLSCTRKGPCPFFRVENAFMRKALPVVPFAHVPFLILQLYQSLSFILEFFPFLVLVLALSLLFVNHVPTLIRVNTVYSPSPPQCLHRINLCSLRTSRRTVTRMAINGPMAYSTAFLHLTLVSYRHLFVPATTFGEHLSGSVPQPLVR
jgi:hypothetical protein